MLYSLDQISSTKERIVKRIGKRRGKRRGKTHTTPVGEFGLNLEISQLPHLGEAPVGPGPEGLALATIGFVAVVDVDESLRPIVVVLIDVALVEIGLVITFLGTPSESH